jgi:superfamily II DNA or RNA helicase
MYEQLYKELLLRYKELENENKRLAKENERMRQQLGLTETNNNAQKISVSEGTTVNKYSSAKEKIELFRSLFKGREDVFARRWQSTTSGKSGYQPICVNEWAVDLCDKRKFKCANCPNRMLKPLSDEDIYKHLEGKDVLARDVVGIYPMLQNETCNFLCADFDDESFEKDVTAFREVCEELEIPVSIERSRSGNGAHAWIFFDAPVPASSARKLGSGILTKAMEKRGELSFKSYDRLFPNQDTMPDGGFGNLVALPLQGLARKSGNSVFVDGQFRPYDDQWAYLSSVRKMNADSVEALVSTFGKDDELGKLVSESDSKPWETKKKIKISHSDFPVVLNVIRANMLYIPTAELSANAKNQIKRLAAFKNPDFYRAQAMRLPIYDKPRIICTADITDDYIAIPRGCEDALYDLLDDADVSYSIENKTNAGNLIPMAFDGELREEQKTAADALLAQNTGVLSATTAFGKTVIASYMIGQRKTNALILVHTQALMAQWKKSLETFLQFDVAPPEEIKGRGRKKAWSPVGVLGAGKDTLYGIVDVAVMQSLVNGDEVKDLVRNYGMIIVDECHHVSAVNFETILKYANAKYVYGLTATPTRQDGHHPIIFMQCGAIRYRVDAKEQAEKRSFEHYLVPRFTNTRSPAETKQSITDIYKKLSENEMRNNMIVSDVADALKSGRNPIVLTERREHVALLAERLSCYCKNVIQLVGTASSKERRETMERLDAIPGEESVVIVATGKYVGEGFDYPRLDTLFLALPIAWKGKVAQYAGRLHRNYDGKTEVQVYDYVDIHIPVLERMYQKRVKSYSAIGYKMKLLSNINATPDLIYDGKSFYEGYCNDLQSARSEILIVSPFMRENRIVGVLKQLSTAIENGVCVTVVTRPPEDFKEKDRENVITCSELLQKQGVTVKYRSDFHQKFTVVDQSVVWYGSVNFLSFGTHEESIMRFENADIAGQLMDTVL